MERTHHRRWPTPIRHDGHDYLTTDQVAKVLGVKTSTVYAYVSRGRIRSVRIDGFDGSLFAVDEIDALRGGARRRPPAGVVERIRTQVSLLENDHLYYRGQDVAELCRTATFEEAAELVWDRRATWSVPSVPVRQIRGLSGADPRGVDLLRLTAATLGARTPLRHSADPSVAVDAVAGIVGATVTVLGADRAETRTVSRLWTALSPLASTPERLGALNAAMVLQIDHGLSAGAVAARVAASARGSIHSVIAAGLGAFDGPMHGGATTLAHRFLASALDDPARAVADWQAAGARIPGTGHVIYRDVDPRAEALLTILAEDERDADPRVGDAIEAVRRATPAGTCVNADLALAALGLRYRMSADAAQTIFALARVVGWTAHALEEYREDRLRFRPEGLYTGPRPR